MERRTLLGSLGAVAIAAAAPVRAQSTAGAIEAPAGSYVLDRTHASLTWRISHFGLSSYTARFTRFDSTLDFNPADLTKCSARAVIDIGSVETDYAQQSSKGDFNADLRGEKFFNVAKFREATWRSTSVQVVEGNRLRIPGELTLLGVSAPVTLDATLNGAVKSRPVTKLPTVGFSARGTIDRRVFGMLTPPPAGTPASGVGAMVEIIIEAEFILPA
ncbi:MAG: YceI family protein [Pseudomonadota bacterium]